MMKISVRSYIICVICVLLLLGLVHVYSGVPTNVVTAVEKYSMAYVFTGGVQTQIGYVERTGGSLHTVSPSGWFNLNVDGSLQVPVNRSQFVVRMHELGVRVVVCLNNDWDQVTGINALNNADSLTDQLAYYVDLYDLDGINVDIENVTPVQRDLYVRFVALLRDKVPAYKEVSVAVAANPSGVTTGWVGSYDYAALSKYVDYFMVMTYDEHYEGSSRAGSVASIDFVEKSVQYALTKTSADKVVLGIPFYGRMWSVGNSNVQGVDVTNSDIDLLVRTYGGVTTFDVGTQSAKVEFTVKSGDTLLSIQGRRLTVGSYVVWFENDRSMQAKMELVQRYDLKGVGAWALGQENVTIWDNYSNWLNGVSSSDNVESSVDDSEPSGGSGGSGSSGSGSSGSGSSGSDFSNDQQLTDSQSDDDSELPLNQLDSVSHTLQFPSYAVFFIFIFLLSFTVLLIFKYRSFLSNRIQKNTGP